MNLALKREYPDPDEAKLIEEMVKVAIERMKPQDGRIRRGQHAKHAQYEKILFVQK